MKRNQAIWFRGFSDQLQDQEVLAYNTDKPVSASSETFRVSVGIARDWSCQETSLNKCLLATRRNLELFLVVQPEPCC